MMLLVLIKYILRADTPICAAELMALQLLSKMNLNLIHFKIRFFFSVVERQIASRPFCGKEMVLSFCINDWKVDGFNGHVVKRKRDLSLQTNSDGLQRDYPLISQKQRKKFIPGIFCSG